MRGAAQPVGFIARSQVGTRLTSILLICILVLSIAPTLVISAPAGARVPAIQATAGNGFVRAAHADLTSKAVIAALPGELSNISVSPTDLRLEPLATALITAAAHDINGSELNDTVFTWTTTVGNLLPTGAQSQMMLQAGLSVNTGVVTVSSGGIDASVQVEVVPGPVASLVLSPAVLVLGTGSFQDLEVRAYDAFGNLVPDATFQWASTGEGDWVLSLTSNSVASFYSGTSGGNAIITVTLGTKVVTLVITVTPEPVKEGPSAMTYAFVATTAVLAGLVAVLLWMLSRQRPGRPSLSRESKDTLSGPDAPH
jgi:hypothetical protein